MTIDWQLFAHPGPANDKLAPRAWMMMGGHGQAAVFENLALSYDRWDYVHFRDRGIGNNRDIWDNLRKPVR